MPGIRGRKHLVGHLEKKSAQKIPLWQWPALLALDTPAITVLWLALFACALYAPLEAPHFLITAGATWLFLAISRSIRAAQDSAADLNDPRIQFFRAERWPLLTVAPFVFLSILIMAVYRLRWLELAGLSALGSLALIYLLCSGFYHRAVEHVLPREIAFSLFAGGTAAVFLLGNGIFPPLHVATLLVLLVVLLILALWTSSTFEWQTRAKAIKPFSLRVPHLELKATWVNGFVALLAIGLAPLGVNAPFSPVYIAIAAAATNLSLLAWFGDALSGISARCLSRLMLLTPIVPLGFAWVGW